MIQWKKDDLPTRQEKEEAAKKQQEHEQLPERVDALETTNNDIILMMADLIGG